MVAYLTLRPTPAYRRDAFQSGLEACGFQVEHIMRRAPRPDDLLVCWNRYGANEVIAQSFEAAGAQVLVAENGYLGREWRGNTWYSLAKAHHNGAGDWCYTGTALQQQRWDSWGIQMPPPRQFELGGEYVVLGTRGLGSPGTREPVGWSQGVARELRERTHLPVRLRPHPGRDESMTVPLLEDLDGARAVITWGSTAALKALLAGIPVYYGLWPWIGALAGVHHSKFPHPIAESAALGQRLTMFRRLAWAMWNVDELATGEPFVRLLSA